MGGEVADGAAVPASAQDKEEKEKTFRGKVVEITFLSGIDLLKNRKKIEPPHWKFRRKEIRPACYTRKSSGDGQKDLEVKIDITKLENISGNGILVGEGGNIKIKSEPFPLKEGESGTIKCEFEDLPDAAYHFNESMILWKVEQGEEVYPLFAPTQATLFIIFNKPQKPWTSTGVKSNWVEVLEFVFGKVGINNYQKKSAGVAITRYLHSSYGLRYDTVSGAPSYGFWGRGFGVFELTHYLKRVFTKVNCYDQAAAATLLSSAIGIGAKYQFLNPFGYINITNLVGVGPCNNPFFDNLDPNVSNKKIWIFGDPKERTGFGNHAFVKTEGKNYDACAGPEVGTRTPAKYIEHSIDIDSTYKPADSTSKSTRISWLESKIKSTNSLSVN